MTRLPHVTQDALDPGQRRLFDAITGGKRRDSAKGVGGFLTPQGGLRGPFNAWMYTPALGEVLQRVGEVLRFAGDLPDRQREIAILCVAARWRADYEWWAHARIALSAGLEREAVDALHRRDRPVFDDPAEALVHDVARALLDEGTIADELFERAREGLGEPALVELVSLVGYYTLVSFNLNAFAVAVPDGEAAPFSD